MPPGPTYRATPTFPALGEGFCDVVSPAQFPEHTRRFRNQRWACRVGLDTLDDEEWTRHLARFVPLPDNLPKALALRYHGHQFGVYNPHLGDGRGFLFAQLRDARDGRLLDIGTKGSGQTPWSRGGDGRLTLKGGVREVLATEMLEALGVYTSKSFSLFETGERLLRGDEPSPTRSSVLVRLSHSHIRFGSFQRLAYIGDDAGRKRLLEFAIEHYVPDLARKPGEEPAAAFLRTVGQRTADLCASWMVAGFVHGVLNTDNMNITGESFDYGPYRFLPTYDPDFVAAYFDESGLYAFGRQPERVHWNVVQLARALRTLAPDGEIESAVNAFEPTLIAAAQTRFLERIGLRAKGPEPDGDLVEACYHYLASSGVGYDQFFFDWHGGAASEKRAMRGPDAGRYAMQEFVAVRRRMESYEPARAERLDDPYYQRTEPCTLLIDEIESIWDAIAKRDDWSAFDAKIADIRAMGAVLRADESARWD